MLGNRFSILDPKYDGLSPNEKIRQVDRDNLIYEQSEAIKNLSNKLNNVSYTSTNVSKIFVIWFCTFVFGGVALIIAILTDSEYKLGLGNIPYYVYLGALLAIMIFGILAKISNTISQYSRKQHIRIIKPNVESEIEKLQDKWDELESKVQIEKTKLEPLKTRLKLIYISNSSYRGDSTEIEKEIVSVESKIKTYVKEQCRIEDEIEKLENKIY